MIDGLGNKPSQATALSAIIGELEKSGYEVVTVSNAGSTYSGVELLEIIDSTGNSVENITLQQTDSTTLKVNLSMTEGTSKVYVNISGLYYELSLNDTKIELSENGQSSVTGEKYTLKLVPTTTKATMKIGETSITSEQTILDGAEITVTALSTIGEENFTIKVENEDGTTKDTKAGNVTIVQKPIHPISMTISATGNKTEIDVDEELQLSVTTNPAVITDTITWSSSDTSKATVDNTGLVTGVAEGTVTITATAKDSENNIQKTATIEIIVLNSKNNSGNAIIFDANGGIFSDGRTTTTVEYSGSTIQAGTYMIPNYLGQYTFDGWNTEANGTGTDYSQSTISSSLAGTTLYAKWKATTVKYAVQIYGINEDVDSSNKTLGLTFGPAVGADYNNAYVTHEYESAGSGNYYVKIITHTVESNGSETTSSAYLYASGGTSTKVMRTTEEKNKYNVNIRNMSWAEIKAASDKTIFTDCMLCGDTKTVGLTLNDTIASGNTFTQYGDGAGILYGAINNAYKFWNNSANNAKSAGAYASSRIRATLIGSNSKTNTTYAGTCLTTSNCLYKCIDSKLRSVITAKKIKYVTGSSTSSYTTNTDIADAIWLLSLREMHGTSSDAYTGEGLNSSNVAYNKFVNTNSKYYFSSYTQSYTTPNRTAYTESGSTKYWYLRTVNLGATDASQTVSGTGNCQLAGYRANSLLRFGIRFLYKMMMKFHSFNKKHKELVKSFVSTFYYTIIIE